MRPYILRVHQRDVAIFLYFNPYRFKWSQSGLLSSSFSVALLCLQTRNKRIFIIFLHVQPVNKYIWLAYWYGYQRRELTCFYLNCYHIMAEEPYRIYSLKFLPLWLYLDLNIIFLFSKCVNHSHGHQGFFRSNHGWKTSSLLFTWCHSVAYVIYSVDLDTVL